MIKKINLKNTIQYPFDIVTCFERPIANQLNYIDVNYGHFFVIISKIYQFYFASKDKNSREEIINLTEKILNVECKIIQRTGFINKVQNAIEKNCPVVIGVNLKGLFYSEYYRKENWPHWLLVTGYDTEKNIYYVLDDVQFLHMENMYGDFIITQKILMSINRKFLSEYDSKWSGFFFEPHQNISINDALIKILDFYFSFNICDKKTFPQLQLLQDLSYISNTNYKYTDLSDEIKKKIINTNKYRSVFVQEIEKYMTKLEYKESSILSMQKYNYELGKQWDQFITSNILNILSNSEIDSEIPDILIELELKIKSILLDFYKYIKFVQKNGQREIQNNFSKKHNKLQIENDVNNIIKIHKNEIVFNFKGDKKYDWWFDDDAPKVILKSKIDSSQSFKIETKIEVDNSFSQEYFQAGIFLRTSNKILFCAIDNGDSFVVDEIGELSKSAFYEFTNISMISVVKDGMNIVATLSNSQSKKLEISWYLNTNENVDVGLACKTWGRTGKAKICFSDYNFSVR